ncbi:MAG: dTDP-4-dehydrorhamnose reductase [Candidatus Thiodiazotropha sp. (ex Myrtea spinifera)]|nr:dTDP-4-dehydrorhamnose reductase [Candidatus Thiodiazotropha sp. (ex Myrtea spinifera)]
MNILLLGSNGQVGWALQRSLAPLGPLVACDRQTANLEDLENVRSVVRENRPDIIVNSAAYTAVDKAESEPSMAERINTEAVALLAEETKRLDACLVHYSTDYVFDGMKSSAYTESDTPNPLSVYGSTKWQGEVAIRQSGCKYLIFRTSWVYAIRGQNFIKTMLRLATDRDELSVVADQFGAPTHADLIADVTALVLHHFQSSKEFNQPNLYGTYNLVAAGETSWNDYARFVFELAEQYGVVLRVKPTEVKQIPSEAYPVPAKRPNNSRLSFKKLERAFNLRLPDWRHHVRRTVKELIEVGEVK